MKTRKRQLPFWPGAVSVKAGPGTGKTGTLTARILHLLKERGVKPSEITAVTFTNKAAAELRQRLEKQTGGKKTVRLLNIGTFHSICLEILKIVILNAFRRRKRCSLRQPGKL